ncbi:MAG: hypothetical protein IPG69_02950 [Flavobacteriales bacterium]|nr:hypothetical protein [Flavobacteriales bacterium]
MTCSSIGGGTTSSTPISVGMGSACLCGVFCAPTNAGGACIESVNLNTLSNFHGLLSNWRPDPLRSGATTTLVQGNPYTVRYVL